MDNVDSFGLRAIAFEMADLAVRMDMLPAYSALLATSRADSRRRLSQQQRSMVCTLLDRLLASVRARNTSQGGHDGVQPTAAAAHDSGNLLPSSAQEFAARILGAVAHSGVLEHCTLELTVAACGGGGTPRLSRTDQLAAAESLVRITEELFDALYSLDVRCVAEDVGRSCGQDSANCSCSASQHVDQGGCCGSAGSGQTGGSEASPTEQHKSLHPLCAPCANVDNASVILSGPCLQYALARHVVGQLAAADGGSTYGLPPAQLPPALTWIEECPDSGVTSEAEHEQRRRRRIGRRQADNGLHVLRVDGMLAAVRMWNACLLSPEVPLMPCGRHAVHALGLRSVQLATQSADWHAARLQEASSKGERCSNSSSGLASGSAAASKPSDRTSTLPLAVPLSGGDCALMALEALRCAALSARPRPASYGATPEPARPGDSGAAAAAAAARYWGVAVPALHMVVTHGAGTLTSDPPLPHLAVQALQLDVPCWAGDLPPAPPPNLSAALSAGYLPLLERGLRTHVASVGYGSLEAASMLASLWGDWRLVGRLMAYGEPRQVAAQMATVGKVIGIASGEGAFCVSAIASGGLEGGKSGPSGDSPEGACDDGDAPAYVQVGRYTASLPLAQMLDWMCGYTVVRQAAPCAKATKQPREAEEPAAEAADAPRSSEAPAGTAGPRTGLGGHICLSRSEAAAIGIEQCPCLRSAGGTDPAAGPAANAGSSSGSFHWAPGPTQQLLHFIVRGLALWLPGVARLAAGMLRARTEDEESGVVGLLLARSVVQWIPPIVHASTGAWGRPEVDDIRSSPSWAMCGDGGCFPAGPYGWQRLLLGNMDALGLLAAALRRLAGMAADGRAAAGLAELPREELKSALEAVQGAYPQRVAEVADGRELLCASDEVLRLIDSAMADDVASPGQDSSDARQRLRQLCDDGFASLSPNARHSRPVTLHDTWYGSGRSSAAKVGALLLEAAALPVPEQAALPACSNPRCCGLEGDSEAELPLRACRGCRVARYCGQECQRAHWRAGHREECGRLQR